MLASPGAPLTSVSVAPACGTSRPTAEGSPAYASQGPAAGTAGLRRDLSGASSLSDNSGQCNTSGPERQEQAMLVLQQHQVVRPSHDRPPLVNQHTNIFLALQLN